MTLQRIIAALLFSVMLASPAFAQGPAPASPALAPATEAASIAPAAPAGTATLERRDLEAWLDGFMPFALARGDIAGGVVVVVKDGAVLLQKGYGYADVARRTPVDPDRTLFRPGSVSKLFTWTAVMQLVEEGRLDLDADVNGYLDFRIPPYDGKPVTLRNIMTHTAGFEEAARYTILPEERLIPLGELLKRSVPRRIFAPGTTPAYSNYATALAGYVVERRSGRSFDDYVDARILRPLGMTRSTFRQPLPDALKPLMSKGYGIASEEPEAFEFVGPAPAGSLSATGADMAKFMIAHLEQGRGLLRPETARQMHETTLTILPPLNRMALGFYEQNPNGRRAIGHGGDTQWFHSDLSLYLDDDVGIFLSLNSTGKEAAAGPLRTALFQQFADRYYPTTRSAARVDAETAREHARMMAGTYANSRGFETTFLRILNLVEPVRLAVDKDGGLAAELVSGLARQPRKWVEIAPFVWRDVDSGERIAAEVVDGRVVRWSFDTVAPFMVFDRTPWPVDGAWLSPATQAAFLVVLLTALAWPVRALARRRFGAAMPLSGRSLQSYRLTGGFAWLAALTLIGWIVFVVVGLDDIDLLGGPLDPLLVTLQVLSPIAFVGLLLLAGWNLWRVWREKRGWFTRLWSVMLLLAAAVLLWVAIAFNLIGFGTNF